MRKIIYISALLITFLPAVQAQKKFNYRDISLLQKKDKTAAPVQDVIAEEDTSGKMDEAPVAENDEAADTTLYQNNLNLPYDSISSWRNLKEYAYTRYLDSLLKNENKKDLKPVEGSSGRGIFSSLLNSGFMKVLLWTLAILFVLFIIYRLFLAEGMFQLSSKQSKNGEAEAEEEVITKESDFDALIRLALQNSNYRQAVRYQYLRTLHALAGKHFIQLAPGKTNFQYVHEIVNQRHQHEFASLTLSYEYVWYGEFNIEKDIYHKIEKKFISLNQKL